MYNKDMKNIAMILAKTVYVLAVGVLLAVVGYWIGGMLFPSSNHDLSDISQGFMQLGVALLGFVLGIVVGGVTVKRL
jgi:hypothetical protein